MTGEAREFGFKLVEIINDKIKEIKFLGNIYKIALIGTGELTVSIKGKGIGGRNQEMLIAFLSSIMGMEINHNFLVTGVNLDGLEGNSKAMGAIVDNNVLDRTIKSNLNLKEYLDINDSSTFFKVIKSQIITGLTGCNVNDLMLILISESSQ